MRLENTAQRFERFAQTIGTDLRRQEQQQHRKLGPDVEPSEQQVSLMTQFVNALEPLGLKALASALVQALQVELASRSALARPGVADKVRETLSQVHAS